MPVIQRDVVFGKLGKVAQDTLRGAHEFARQRGDAYIEPVHWLALWLRTEGCDVATALDRAGIARERVLQGLERALGLLRRSRSSRIEFSQELDLAIERGWLTASLVFGHGRVRTGHLLHAMLDTPELKRLLLDVSDAFRGLEAEALLNRWGELTRGSAEDGLELEAPPLAPQAPGADPGQGGTAKGALDTYTSDLTALARSGKLDPVLGRDREIRETVDVLMRRRQNNPIIVGEAGVGKTALVEGLALRVAAGDVPPQLKDIRLLALDLSAMQAGASVKGEFEKRLKQVVDEVQRSERPIVLFIDEAHTLIGAGGAAGTGDAANLLKPALARGTLRTIAATTWAEYKQHIEKDPALTRRFQVVQVGEPDEDKAIRMLRAMAGVFAAHHGVELVDEAVQAAVKLSRRYIQGRQLPDKAVSVLDTACARVAMSQHGPPADLEDCRRRIGDLETELAALERERRLGIADPERTGKLTAELGEERAALAALEERHGAERGLVERILSLKGRLRDAEDAGLLAELAQSQEELRASQGDRPLVLPAVDAQAVASVVESWTGIPLGRMMDDELAAVLCLKETLGERVIGQAHALDAIAQRIETAKAGLENPGKPIGVFLLVGPSGVGKTETALAVAEALYGGEDHAVTINMSEFQEAHTVSTLKGAPPGYKGYGEGGRLTEAVRRKPYSVLLLDEVEKAHPDVHEIFFQVFDKGIMDDSEGRRIDFRNTLVMMTSNVGSDLIARLCAEEDALPDPQAVAQALRPALLRVFPAAFLGRVVVVPYYPLGTRMLGEIIRLQLARVGRRVAASRGVPFTYDDAVVDHILRRCTEVESGGRMVDSILTGSLLPTVSREILERLRGRRPLSRVHVGVRDGAFAYDFDGVEASATDGALA